MKKVSKTILFVSIGVAICDALCIAFCVWSALTDFAEPQYTLMIVFINFGYHFTYRPIVGFIVKAFGNKVNVESKTYRIKSAETKRLEKIGIKKWKDALPAWDRDSFVLTLADIKSADKLQLALRGNICAEIVHHTNFFLSFATCFLAFVPTLRPLWYVFFVTGFVTAVVADLPYVLIQRYNRFRLLALYERVKKAETLKKGSDKEAKTETQSA